MRWMVYDHGMGYGWVIDGMCMVQMDSVWDGSWIEYGRIWTDVDDGLCGRIRIDYGWRMIGCYMDLLLVEYRWRLGWNMD